MWCEKNRCYHGNQWQVSNYFVTKCPVPSGDACCIQGVVEHNSAGRCKRKANRETPKQICEAHSRTEIWKAFHKLEKGSERFESTADTLLPSFTCKFLLSLFSLLLSHQRMWGLEMSLGKKNTNPPLWLAKSLLMPGCAQHWDAKLRASLLCSWQVQALCTDQVNRQSRAWPLSVCL